MESDFFNSNSHFFGCHKIMKCYAGLNEVQSGTNREEVLKRAEKDPEVQAVLNDPIMQTILQQMQSDPGAYKE